MTEIKVEHDKRGGGVPWWVWAILALLIVAALLWWLLDDDDDAELVREPVTAEMVAPIEPVGTPGAIGDAGAIAPGDQTAAGAAGPITDASLLYDGIDQQMVDRPVRLSGVRILEVVGDAGFWVGENEQRRVYAILDEVRTPDTPTEGRVDLNPGQLVDLNGIVRTSREGLGQLATGPGRAQLPSGVDHFVVVDRAQIQTRP